MNCLILEGKERQKNMITKVTTRLRLVTSITKHQNIMRWRGGSRHYNHEDNEALDADCHDGGTAARLHNQLLAKSTGVASARMPPPEAKQRKIEKIMKIYI